MPAAALDCSDGFFFFFLQSLAAGPQAPILPEAAEVARRSYNAGVRALAYGSLLGALGTQGLGFRVLGFGGLHPCAKWQHDCKLIGVMAQMLCRRQPMWPPACHQQLVTLRCDLQTGGDDASGERHARAVAQRFPGSVYQFISIASCAGFLGVAAGATLAVRAMGVHSPDEFRDVVRSAVQPVADALRSRAAGFKAGIEVRRDLKRGLNCLKTSTEKLSEVFSGSDGAASGQCTALLCCRLQGCCLSCAAASPNVPAL